MHHMRLWLEWRGSTTDPAVGAHRAAPNALAGYIERRGRKGGKGKRGDKSPTRSSQSMASTALTGWLTRLQLGGDLPLQTTEIVWKHLWVNLQNWVTDQNSLITFDCKLFVWITSNGEHLLYTLLPPERECHNFPLPDRTSVLKDENFITRML